MVSDASSYLFQVMNNKLYFKDVTIIVPPNWTGNYSRTNTETYEKVKYHFFLHCEIFHYHINDG